MVTGIRRYLPLVWYFLLPLAVSMTVPAAPAAGPVPPSGAPPSLRAPAAELLEAGVIRLFCSPCFDRYAQELRVDDLRWVRGEEAGQDEPEGGRTAPGATDGAGASGSAGADGGATGDPGADDSVPTPQWFVVADGATFDPAIVYVRIDGVWINLAVRAGLPAPGTLPILPAYITVSPPPRHR